MPRQGRLAAAGYERVGPERLRHYRAPDGREVSYRQAFVEARGESLESAVKQPGKFRDELRTAERVRFLAREGLLSETTAVTRRDERTIAKATLRELTKGHYSSAATKAGLKGETPETTPAGKVYGRAILDTLHAEPTVKAGMSEADIEAEVERINSPTGDKANLLVALNYREPSADYDVGDTP